MHQSHLAGGASLDGALQLCFETKTQAQSLVRMARMLADHLGPAVDLVYCLPSGHDVTDALAPWLDELAAELRQHCDSKVGVRIAPRDIARLVVDLGLDPLAVAFVATDPDDIQATRWATKLLQEAPIEVALLHGEFPQHVDRILLAADAGPTHAMAAGIASRVAARFNTPIVVVAPTSPHQRMVTAVRNLDQIANTARSIFDVRAYQRVVRHRSREGALLAAARSQQPDLVFAGLRRGGLVGEFAAAQVPHRLMRRSPSPLVLVNGPVRPALQRVTTAAYRVFTVLPTLPLGQRAVIYSQVRRSARSDIDFLFMIVASTAIAALGLRLDSAVVIIGAMLVAPLMSPIMAVGLGVAQGDARLLSLGVRSVVRGVLLAVVASFALGILIPGGYVTGEMLKRAHPSLLDLAVAIASGCAGAYALSRKGVSSSLPGVAIAVSLVPPLATAGVALSLRDPGIAAGSFLLFVINLAAVAAASGVMFVWMGFSPEIDQLGRRRTFGKGVAGLGAMLIAVTLPLAWDAMNTNYDPGAEATVTGVLASRTDSIDGVRILDIETEASGGQLIVDATIEAERPLSKGDILSIQSEIEEAVGRPVVLSLRLELLTTVGDD